MEASTRAQPYITSVSTCNIDNHIHQTIEIRLAEVGISKRGGGGGVNGNRLLNYSVCFCSESKKNILTLYVDCSDIICTLCNANTPDPEGKFVEKKLYVTSANIMSCSSLLGRELLPCLTNDGTVYRPRHAFPESCMNIQYLPLFNDINI